jgi:Tfp pilus assembly protein PilP
MRRNTWVFVLLLFGTLMAPLADSAHAGAPPKKPPAPVAPTPSASSEALQQRLTILRRKVLRDEDFNETDDTNRDPFRSFLGIFADRGTRTVIPQSVPSIFGKFALEELTLIAVISGDANPRAMFRDPSGLGQVIKRGDYLSKSAARVTKILSDRVVLELAEATSGGETRALEKAILVNPEGAEK